MRCTLTINGRPRALDLPDRATLLEALRGPLDLTAAKPACDVGDCGACAVLVGGEPTLACLTLAAEVGDRAVLTAEGLADGEALHPLQVAFHELGASQCGYCTPGFLIAGAALLAEDPHPSDAAIARALSGNLCRCTGYTRIFAAVRRAAELLRAPAAGEGSP